MEKVVDDSPSVVSAVLMETVLLGDVGLKIELDPTAIRVVLPSAEVVTCPFVLVSSTLKVEPDWLRPSVDTKVLDAEEEENVDGIDVVELISDCVVPASRELTEV